MGFGVALILTYGFCSYDDGLYGIKLNVPIEQEGVSSAMLADNSAPWSIYDPRSPSGKVSFAPHTVAT